MRYRMGDGLWVRLVDVGAALSARTYPEDAEVVFEVRSSLNDNPGTIVKEETKNMEDVVVRGVSLPQLAPQPAHQRGEGIACGGGRAPQIWLPNSS